MLTLLLPSNTLAQAQSVCFILVDRNTHTISGTVNTYFPGTATAAAGSTAISLGRGRGANLDIASGDLLLVIQMQDAIINSSNSSAYGSGGTSGSGYISPNNTGMYEYIVARSSVSFATGGTLTLTGSGAGGGLLNTYTNAEDNNTDSGQHRFQVIRVPAYLNTSLNGNLTASPWDGHTGGAIVLETVNTLTFSGYSLNGDSLGFRGGGGRQLGGGTGSNTDYRTLSSNPANASKGEGIAGIPHYVFYSGILSDTQPIYSDGYPLGSYARGAPGNAGGGSTDGLPSQNSQNSGGGGGGNGGAGGQGGHSWSSNLDIGGKGGAVFAERGAGRVVLGGGGGAGTTNNGTGTPGAGLASSGAAGGGIVIIRTAQVSGPGTISVNGANSLNVLYDSTGGGGAGGSVLVITQNANPLSSLTISAIGGNGGNAWPNQPPGFPYPGNRHGPGGGGGGGVVFLSSAASSIAVSGGINGTTTTAQDTYGATPGASGYSNTSITIADIPGAEAGFECFTPTVIVLTSLRGGSTEGPDLTIPLVIVILIMNLVALWLYRDKKHRHKPKSKLPDSSQEPSRNT